MSFNGPPKMPQPKLTIDQLASETPISGIGYERFTDVQRKDLDAFLSRNGASLSDPLLKDLKGEDLMDMMDYVHAKPNTPERAQSGVRIQEALARLMEGSSAEEYKKAA